MRKLIAVCSLVLVVSGPLLSQQKNPAQPRRQNAIPRRFVEDTTLVFYTREFRKVAAVSDEVFGKIYPSLEQFIDERFEISQRKQRALNQLRNLVNRGGSDEELKQMTAEVDSADKEMQSNQERFLSSVDPFLNPLQQAKLRIFQQMADNRVRQLIANIQAQNQNRNQNQPAPDTKDK